MGHQVKTIQTHHLKNQVDFAEEQLRHRNPLQNHSFIDHY
mgnify:CR=1 FL=1